MARTSIVLGLVVALCACGGGGDDSGPAGPPGPTGPLAGSYHYVSLDRFLIGGAVRSETGQAAFDGAGTLSFGTAYAAEEGAASGPFSRPAATYALTAGRDLAITEAGGRLLNGVASADEKLASGVSLVNGQDPGMLLLIRRDTAPSQADLAGSWVLFQWSRYPAPGGYASSTVGSVTIDAVGDFNVSSYHYNRDGAIDPIPAIFFPVELVVSSGGWLLRRSSGAVEPSQRGGISVDHDIIVLGNVGPTRLDAGIAVLIRVDAAPTDATLDGVYGLVGFQSAGYGPYTALGGLLEMDGLGSGTRTNVVNIDGTSAVGTVASVYTVHPSGRATITFPGPIDTWGAVGPSGRFAVWTGYSTPGAQPTFSFLIR